MSGTQSISLLLRWSDVDTYRHVNNVEIHRLCDEARVRAMSAWLGGSRPLDRFPVVVAAMSIDYLTPLAYGPDPVAVQVDVERVTDIGADVSYELTDHPTNGGRRYAHAWARVIAFDLERAAPRMLSEHEYRTYRSVCANRTARAGARPGNTAARPPLRGEPSGGR